MKLRVLGCSGGIGGRHLRTTSFLVDHDILLDAGTGAAELSLGELAAIDHVFLTHAHLDHIAALPLILDSVAERRQQALTVYASAEVIGVLRAHVFNWAIWPDFTEVPSCEAPLLRYQPVVVGESVDIDGRRFTPLPANHTVPAVGYRLEGALGSLVFSGDTGPCDAFWAAINGIDNLRYLIIECAFSSKEAELARLSKHLCPQTLAAGLAKLSRPCELLVSHLKPGQIDVTMDEIQSWLEDYGPQMLQNNQIFEF